MQVFNSRQPVNYMTLTILFSLCIDPDLESNEGDIDYYEGQVLERQIALSEVVKKDSPKEFTRITQRIIYNKENVTFLLSRRGN